MLFDMHIHTTCSDGLLKPNKIIELAMAKRFEVISITDHDTVKAYSKIDRDLCKGIKIIPGIELSTLEMVSEKKKSIHILGYNIDVHNTDLKTELDNIEIARMKEIKAVIKILLEKVDGRVTVRNILASQKKLTMNAIAYYLCELGYAKSKEEAYDLYLFDERVAFVQKKCMTPQRAVQVIKNAGGLAVLAHPNRIKGTHSYIYELVSRLKKVGLDGVEVYCKGMSDEELGFYRKICEEEKLVISAGSDFHKEGDLFGCWKEDCNISTEKIEKESIINIL